MKDLWMMFALCCIVADSFASPTSNCVFTKYEKKYLIGTCQQSKDYPLGVTLCVVPPRADGVTLPPEPLEYNSRIHTYCVGLNTECILEYIVKNTFYGSCLRNSNTNEEVCFHSEANFSTKCISQ